MLTDTKEVPGLRIISDPKEYIDRPFERSETVGLAQAPTVDLLRYIPRVDHCTPSLIRDSEGWLMVKTSPGGIIPSFWPGVDLFLHSHIRGDIFGGAIPHVTDFRNVRDSIRNILISEVGLTEYRKPLPEVWEQFNQEVNMFRYRLGTPRDYMAFLIDTGVAYQVHTWKSLDEEKLAELFEASKLGQ